jgi:hypothetical protein
MKHTDAVTMMGQTQPAKDVEGVTWISKDKMSTSEGDVVTIIRFDINKIYQINHSKKTYSEIDLPVDLEKTLPPQGKQMLDMMEASVKVADTGETLKIKEWDCKKYLVEIDVSMMGMTMPMKMNIWTSQDIDINLDLYKKFNSEITEMNPFVKGFAEEFKKIRGYPILTEFSMKMMGTESKYREEVISVEKKDAPAGTYDLPEGYTKTAFNPFPFEQGR